MYGGPGMTAAHRARQNRRLSRACLLRRRDPSAGREAARNDRRHIGCRCQGIERRAEGSAPGSTVPVQLHDGAVREGRAVADAEPSGARRSRPPADRQLLRRPLPLCGLARHPRRAEAQPRPAAATAPSNTRRSTDRLRRRHSSLRGSSMAKVRCWVGCGVVVIKLTPSGASKRCHAPCGTITTIPALSA